MHTATPRTACQLVHQELQTTGGLVSFVDNKHGADMQHTASRSQHRLGVNFLLHLTLFLKFAPAPSTLKSQQYTMNRASYSRVPQTEASEADASKTNTVKPKLRNSDIENSKRQHRNRVEQCSSKVQAFLWIVAAGFVVYSTNLLNVVVYDERVHRGWFNLGLFCFGLSIAMTLYAIVWLPYVKKVQYDVEVVSPRFYPVLAVVFCLQGLWYVYSL